MTGDNAALPPDALISLCQGIMADGRIVADTLQGRRR